MENVNGLDWAQAQYDRQEPSYKVPLPHGQRSFLPGFLAFLTVML